MKDFELVVVGGGLASARAIVAYRDAGGGGAVALVSADDTVPYHRPPLSKAYLRGESEREATLVEPPARYAQLGVELLLGRVVEGVDLEGRTVSLVGGGQLGYRQLLVATGAVPRRLPVPGGDLPRVFVLRSLADSTRIREAARAARRAVVVGAGFIGMEVTASLRRLGVEVSQVHLGRELYDQLRSPTLSRHLERLYREQGVELVLEDAVEALEGDGSVERVRLRSGRELPADLVVVGVGVAPATGWLEGSGLELDDGVVVNERFETNVEGVRAAGDVARFWDPVLGRRRRIEHWSNANYQGTEVGKLLAGAEGSYDTVSSFFSEVFGFMFRLFGDVSDDFRPTGEVSGLYLEGDRLVGALAVDADDEEQERLKAAIRAGTPDAADR